MNSFDIDKYFGKRVAYPKDQLPIRFNVNDILIIKFHDSNRPGSHWVALKIGKNDAYYFTSFGEFPLNEVKDICDKNKLG